MIGMNATTGRALRGLDHLTQSVGKILTTPQGSRLQRRTFGAPLFELLDAPNNMATRVRVYASAASALMRWEPRLKLTRIGLSIDPSTPGNVVVEIEGTTDISPNMVAIAVPLALTRSAP